MQWQKKWLVVVLFEEFGDELAVIVNRFEVLGIEVRHFLPDFLTVECGFVDAIVVLLDVTDDGRDDTEATSLCEGFLGRRGRREIVIVMTGSYDRFAALKGSELKVAHLA